MCLFTENIPDRHVYLWSKAPIISTLAVSHYMQKMVKLGKYENNMP